MTYTEIKNSIKDLTVEQRLSLMRMLSCMSSPEQLSKAWENEIDAIESRIKSGETKTTSHTDIKASFNKKYAI